MRKSVKITLGGIAGVTALFIGVGAASGGSHAAAVPAPSVSTTAPAQPTTTAPVSPAASAPATKAPAKPAKPAVTASQAQALDSANGYIQDGQGFSRDGLISQLQSEKFSSVDAAWAADHTGADWNAQAVLSAKGYMSDGEGFSRGSLISQLQFEKFTYAQASHAASVVGL